MRRLALAAVAATLAAALASGAAVAGADCSAPGDAVRLGAPLPRTAARLLAGQALTIVALGSSSTSGFGATSPSHTYPGRLAVELRHLLPGRDISVVNKGVGGETAVDMVRRFDRDVFALKPDLVIWQVGTNAVIHDLDLTGYGDVVRAGIERLKAAGIDVVVMDLQYAPKVVNRPAHAEMQASLAAAAAAEGVPLFRRFDIMRHWVEERRLGFGHVLNDDGLHLNDFSYGCVAHLLAAAIVQDAHAAPAALSSRRVR